MRIKTQINKDLDLRRYGKNLYTKAKESNGEGSGDLGKQFAEAFVNNLFKRYNMSVPSNFVYPDFIAYIPYEESETTIIDSIAALVELIDDISKPEICLYKQKPFETSPYTITGNESKVYMLSGDHLIPTIHYDNEDYKVDIYEGEINGETFYSITHHMEVNPDGPTS